MRKILKFLKIFSILTIFLSFSIAVFVLFVLWKYSPELPSYEELKNYRELWDWMVGIGFPKQHKQWETALSAGTSAVVLKTSSPDQGDRDNPTFDEGNLYSDGSLIIYNSKNNPKVELSFYQMFPTSLSGLSFSQQEADVEYLRADASFRFLYYDFKVSA